MSKTYKQLMEETKQNMFSGIPIPKLGDIAGGIGKFALGTVVSGALSSLIPRPGGARQAQQTQDQARMVAQNKEFRDAATLDQQAQTAQAKMAKFNQQAPLGTQRKQPNIINAPRQDLSGQRTELV